MEKKELFGVQKRKKPTKRNKKRLLKKFVDYLKSDCYMFFPLISPPQTDFLASRIVSSSTSGVELKGNKKEKIKRRFVEKVGEYMKSNSYLYAPLCVPQHLTSTKGFSQYINRITMEIATRKLIRKNDRSTIEASKVAVDDECTEGNIPERSISGQQKFVHEKTVKHMVYQSCRSSSVSGKGILDRRLRKFLID